MKDRFPPKKTIMHLSRNNGNICVFSSANKIEHFEQVAFRTGELIAQYDFGLVHGGFNTGLMGAVALGARINGAKVTGVVPRAEDDPYLQTPFVISSLRDNDRLVHTTSLAERKHRMLGLSKAVIALPGGFGTLDEMAAVLELARRSKNNSASASFAIINSMGYYDGLKIQLERMEEDKTIPGQASDHAYFAETPEDAMEFIKNSTKSGIFGVINNGG